ncbi:MAG: UBP-type zinc finger domain-containing protein [Cyclobacteriaceae bacterium]
MASTCSHLDQWTKLVPSKGYQCEECVKLGSSWVHLRTCQECGATLCCDSSPNQHASKHAKAHQHWVAISAEPGEKWAWCYQDEQFVEY